MEQNNTLTIETASFAVQPDNEGIPLKNIESQAGSRDSEGSRASSVDEKSSGLEISCNLLKSFIGIGILSLSYGFKEAGIILTNLLIIICSFLTFWSISFCVKVADHLKIRITSFSDLCYVITGKWGFFIARACVVILQVGVCAVYVSFFGIFFNNVFCYTGISSLCTYFGLDLVLCLIIIIPLSLIKNLTKYNRFSLIANIFVSISLLIILAISFQGLSTYGIEGKKLFIFEKFPLCFGITIFVIECIGIVFEMRDSMKEPEKFEGILIKNFIVATALYTILPTIFYMSFGEKVQELIVFNIPIENPFGMFVQILYATALCISYPLQLFPVFIIIEETIKGDKTKNFILDRNQYSKHKFMNKIKTFSLRLIIVCLIILISWGIPSIATFINLLGAFGSTTLGMLFPVIIGELYLYYYKVSDHYPLYSRIINWIASIFGLVGGCFAISFSIIKMVEA